MHNCNKKTLPVIMLLKRHPFCLPFILCVFFRLTSSSLSFTCELMPKLLKICANVTGKVSRRRLVAKPRYLSLASRIYVSSRYIRVETHENIRSSPLKTLINCCLRNARCAHCGHSVNVHLLETKS